MRNKLEDETLSGEKGQPYSYHWRKKRKELGWKFLGYFLPPQAQKDFREWFRNYKETNKEIFKVNEEGK